MKKLEFEPDYFEMQKFSTKQIAAFAQTKFDDWFKANIESAPLVHGFYDCRGAVFSETKFNTHQTHTARLIDIQEIKRECVRHEPEHIFIGPETGKWSTKCKHCHVELIADWRARE